MSTLPSRRDFVFRLTLGLIALPLAGCGAVKNAVNNDIPPIEDPASLSGKAFPITVAPPVSGVSGTALVGSGNHIGAFPDLTPVNGQSHLSFAEFQQNLRSEIQFTPGTGTDYPSRITLSDIAMVVRFYETATAGGPVTREITLPTLHSPSGNLVFARVGETNSYQLQNSTQEIALDSVRVSGDDARTLFALLTSTDSIGSNANFVSASLGVSADANGVTIPGVIVFTFGTAEVRVGI